MKRHIVSFGCSFVQGSHEKENLNRANIGDTPTYPKQQLHEGLKPHVSKGWEACFTSELGELVGTPTINQSLPGSGIRSAVYKALDYVENDKNALNSYIIIGLSELSRFEFIRPSIKDSWPILPIPTYAEYYDKQDVILEIQMLLKLTYGYFKEKNIPILFINTMNVDISTKDIVPTFIFPDSSEYWRRYLTSSDPAYRYEHPNIADHKHLAKLLADKLEL